jgi:hypothetical protein
LFHSLRNFPKLRAIVLFDQPRGETPTGLPIDWSLGEVAETYKYLAQQPELLSQFTREMER